MMETQRLLRTSALLEPARASFLVMVWFADHLRPVKIQVFVIPRQVIVHTLLHLMVPTVLLAVETRPMLFAPLGNVSFMTTAKV